MGVCCCVTNRFSFSFFADRSVDIIRFSRNYCRNFISLPKIKRISCLSLFTCAESKIIIFSGAGISSDLVESDGAGSSFELNHASSNLRAEAEVVARRKHCESPLICFFILLIVRITNYARLGFLSNPILS
jgi:hypothetical protein